MDEERNQIKDYELEAQQLERLEADLLRRLQDTQVQEREAFNKLESAMLDASLPTKVRVQVNQKKFSPENSQSEEVRSLNQHDVN